MKKIFFELQRWFAEQNITTDGLTVILNFDAGMPAAQFDAAIRNELSDISMMMPTCYEMASLLRKMDVGGIKVIVESPVHGPVHT